ncbi:class I SAM-dependent methyltransferase [Azotobacter beijerinckii]|uniref:Methyltransferase domain-containing protein n=1 Tax=Azotobacter beijerinckii TaxID=170623 RepID=A0A1I0WBG6_9GAMM|nr:class I SAM-dependent methyltransferase [Azotobacter beijerinckii]SFA85560.1 Methyltransferase domain-containing protein [Azotobacter beijerinckii]
MTLDWTGERFIPGIPGIIELEHMHRYTLALSRAQGMDVLDLASGEGYGSHLLSSVARSVIGVDISSAAIEHAQVTYHVDNLEYRTGSCAAIPVESGTIDLVVSFETIEHHVEHDAMMREILRVLRPDGLLMISSPNRPEFDKMLTGPNEFHVKELNFDEFAGLLGNYFPHIAYYAQRVIAGSTISTFGHQEAGFVNFNAGAKDLEKTPHLARPIYFLALAGFSEPPQLGTSIYENSAGLSPTSQSSSLTAKVYWNEKRAGVASGYSEARTATAWYSADGESQTLTLPFSGDLGSLVGLRLDIADEPTAIVLHGMRLVDPDGHEFWQWPGNTDTFAKASGVAFFREGDDKPYTLFALDDDPQFELALPTEVLAAIRPDCALLLDITPCSLASQLPRLFAHAPSPNHQASASPAAGFEDIAELLHARLDKKSRLIASQKEQIQRLEKAQEQQHQQLLHAESQLALLKGFLIGNGRVKPL